MQVPCFRSNEHRSPAGQAREPCRPTGGRSRRKKPAESDIEGYVWPALRVSNIPNVGKSVIIMVRLAPSWELRTSGARMQEREILRAQERMFPRSIMGELNDVLGRFPTL